MDLALQIHVVQGPTVGHDEALTTGEEALRVSWVIEGSGLDKSGGSEILDVFKVQPKASW